MKRSIAIFLVILFCGAVLYAQQSAGLAFADKPAVLTSIGQSADVEMVRVLLTRAKMPFRADPQLQAAALSSDDKTLIVVIGGSSKGLGAAGISTEDEMKRAEALIKKARDLGMKIIAVHVGGEARRGTLSDGFIKYAVPESDYVIVVSEADKDGLFTNLAKDAKIACTEVNKIAEVQAPLVAAFK